MPKRKSFMPGHSGRGGHNRLPIDFEEVRRLYVDERILPKEIALRYGCSKTIIYDRLRALGVLRTNSEAHRGQIPHNKVGRALDRHSGYYVTHATPDDPFAAMASKCHHVPEHRLIMAKHLGRCLEPQEVVHHKNHDTGDNRLENLQLFANNVEHIAHHRKERNWPG